MTCDTADLNCAIEQLGRTLTDFDASTFFLTTVATAIGVLVGALPPAVIYYLERRRAQRERLGSALSALMEVISDFCVKTNDFYSPSRTSTLIRRRKTESFDWPVIGSIAAARMLCTSADDRAILDRIRELVLVGRSAEPSIRTFNLSYVWRICIVWQGGQRVAATLRDIDELIAATIAGATYDDHFRDRDTTRISRSVTSPSASQ